MQDVGKPIATISFSGGGIKADIITFHPFHPLDLTPRGTGGTTVEVAENSCVRRAAKSGLGEVEISSFMVELGEYANGFMHSKKSRMLLKRNENAIGTVKTHRFHAIN